WCYDRHRSVRLVVLVGLAIDQIAQSGLSSLSVIYYSAQLFRAWGEAVSTVTVNNQVLTQKWVGALPTHASTELCRVIMGLRFGATKVM
ncbi:hypothetical protein, partial [Klebsiella pneumoniae]|uniref:hypothetical protein n=1 Tax=Klebsiella pneumoniae TaxID=573 RepID=UPI000DF0D7DA